MVTFYHTWDDHWIILIRIHFYSFIQYIFLSPSYTNILNVYAFCNIHDVSWGTKGDNKVNTDLGVVQAKKDESGEHTAEIDLPTEQKDMNEAYEAACIELQRKPEVEVQHRDAQTKQEDYYRSFRTRLILFWIISNLILVICVTSATVFGWWGDFDRRSTVYLGFILWSVAGLSVIRFCGATLYLILRIFTG